MMGGLGFGMLGIGAFIMFAFWALIIGGIVWLVVTLARASQGQSAAHMPTGAPALNHQGDLGQTPLDILKMRYAKGELTKEQFDDMKHNLGV